MRRPESSPVTQPPPSAPADGHRPPQDVPFDAFNAALEPLLNLVGTDVMSIFADGFSVTSEAIQFTSAAPVPGVEPVAVGDDPQWQEYGWPVAVTVRRP